MSININNFPKDINDRVASDFEKSQQVVVFSMLINLKKDVKSLRILRCVIYLAKGNIEHLKHYCDNAKIDYRDVIFGAESDNYDSRVRNFNMPFSKIEG